LNLASEEEKQMAEEMKAIRFRKLREVTEEDRILADVMRSTHPHYCTPLSSI
jgi:hypothetical protein